MILLLTKSFKRYENKDVIKVFMALIYGENGQICPLHA